MADEIYFYPFDLEAEVNAPTLSSVENSQVYIAIECQNARCDKRKLLHPSDLPVSPDDFRTLEISKIANKMRCTRCNRTNPLISFFREYDPLYTGKLVSEKDLVSLQQLDADESFSKRYNYERIGSDWERAYTYDDDLYDHGSAPDPKWSDSAQLVGSDPGMTEVDQLVNEVEQLANLEAANASDPKSRKEE